MNKSPPESIEVSYLSRREFVRRGLFGLGGGLVVSATGCSNTDSSDLVDHASLALFFSWDEARQQYCFVVPRAEMGQGTHSTLAGLFLNEIHLPMDMIYIKSAAANPTYGQQLTVGSSSIRNSWQRFQNMGATTAQTLLQVGADEWQIPTSQCRLQSGLVINTDSKASLPLHQLLPKIKSFASGSKQSLQTIKNSTQGTAKQTLLDIVTGRQIYTADVKIPDQYYAMIARPPHKDAKLKPTSFSAIENLPNIHKVFTLDIAGNGNANAIAIVGLDFYSVFRAKNQIAAEWDKQNLVLSSSQQLPHSLNQNMDQAMGVADSAKDKITARYYTPPLAHQPMETPVCIAAVSSNKIKIIAPTQAPLEAAQAVAKRLGRNSNEVELSNMRLGGGFGRKRYHDFIIEAALISEQTQAPIKLIWTREDDIQSGFFRPASLQELSWDPKSTSPIQHKFLETHYSSENTNAGPSSEQVFPFFGEGSHSTYMRVASNINRGIWRAVHHGFLGFGFGVFIDECAEQENKNVFDFIVQNMPSRDLVEELKFRIKPAYRFAEQRMLNVLNTLKGASGWTSNQQYKSQNRLLGLAHYHVFGTYVATVVELKPRQDKFYVSDIWTTVDCGTPLNLSHIKAQIEGGNIYALSAALHGEIPFEQGAVTATNFHNQAIVSMQHCPKIHVDIADSNDLPSGVGELAVPPLAAALANALYAATGERLRSLPLQHRLLIS